GSAESELSVFCVPAKIICWIFNNTGDTDYNTAPNTPSVVFTADEAMHCIDITIEVDGAVENSEMFSVMLSTTEERVNLFPALANITIIDNDNVIIGFAGGAMIRFVNESSSQIEECVVLSHFNLQRELTVTIVTEEESATVEDFNPLDAFSVVFHTR
ncbi:hypothetical protein GBAR_LOCUS188, partial [Geodia barretti]